MCFYLRINFHALGANKPEPTPSADPWLLYASCSAKDADACILFQQIAAMVPKDQKAAFAALDKLIQVAASGQPITNFYDKKQCHDTYTFHYKGKDRTVWRIWKGDVVRVTFFYGDGKAILLTTAFAKYEDKLTKAQELMLENEVKAYIDAVANKSIKLFEKPKK